MKEIIFDQKINALNKFANLNKSDIRRFADIIKDLDKWDTFRINPLRFAEEHNFDVQSITDIFVHSAKIGLFDFAWNLICPLCGGIEYSDNNLNTFSENIDFECITCNKNIEVEMSSQMEVSFTLNEIIREFKIFPGGDIDSYRKYFYSSNYVPPIQVFEFIKTLLFGIYEIEPDETKIITFDADKNKLYRFLSLQTHTKLLVNTSEEESDIPQIAEVDLLSNGFAHNQFNLKSGKVSIYIHNRTKSNMILSLFKFEQDELSKVISKYPAKIHLFMTGKMLLNNQSFRELFRVQSLSHDLKLSVKSLTIMFTDLKGSTEMYDKVGDYNAYSVVQKHFQLLTKSVRKYSGAIVKTMGDAIMATFSNPLDAFLSARDMIEEIENLNSEGNEKIGLKIGINEGNALAVNADERLDYFGQAINIAARVQGLAQEGEIWLTENVYNGNQVRDYLDNMGCNIDKQSAILKGVGSPVIVYKCV